MTEAPKKSLPRVIGEMTVLWNDCQALIFLMFHRTLALTLPQARAIFFTLRNDNSQRDITAALISASVPDALATRTAASINKFAKMAGSRNAFIHTTWDYSKDPEVAAVWMNERPALTGVTDPVAFCETLISDLQNMYAELDGVKDEIYAALAAALSAVPPEQLAGPLRQGDAQKASSALALQQGDPSAQSRPVQSSEP